MREGPLERLDAFTRRALRVDGRRRVLRGVLDLVLMVAIGGALAVAVTALTMRGDRVAWVCVACAAAGAGFWAYGRWRAHRRRIGPALLRGARVVARTRGPLADPPLSRDDEALRRELLGAVELALAHGWGQPEGAPTSAPRPGSTQLAQAYAADVAARLQDAQPRRAVAPLAWRPRVMAMIPLAATWLALLTTPSTAAAFDALVHFEDARPPTPPEPIWSRLELTITYPEHTGRPSRRVPNPTGALRLPAGSEVEVAFWSPRSAEAARLNLIHGGAQGESSADPELIGLERVEGETDASSAGAPKHDTHWRGRMTVRGPATWFAQLLDDEDASSDDAEVLAHSPRQRIELEADSPPQVELSPLSDAAKEASELDDVTLRFSANDDFGLDRAELVYQLSDGSVHRLPIGDAPGRERRWSKRYTWHLADVPVDERGQLVVWIEVWDNDPGLGLDAQSALSSRSEAEGGLNPERGGKVARSARQQLSVRDREREHRENIESLRALRDAAVDLLAARLLSLDIFDDPKAVWTRRREAADIAPDPVALQNPDPLALQVQGQLQVQAARDLHQAAGELLAQIAQAVDALSVDPLARERDVRTLAAIHARLLELFRDEEGLHEKLSPGAERSASVPGLRKFLAGLGRHNRDEQSQLEDEIIRLDDLVDGELIRQLEAMSARLEASQQKLVELLESLKAGDESVRPQIEQLQERIREDMRRFQETRQQLSKEVSREFLNQDAFENLAKMMRNQDLLEALRQGDVDKALQQAREALDEMRGINDAIQDRAGQGGEEARLDPEEEARMQLLRELGRLQDQQRGLSGQARQLEQSWREAVGERGASDGPERSAREAREMLEALEKINDARLSREGREAFEDAREALERLAESSESPDASTALPLWDAANRASEALESAQRGTPEDEKAAERLEAIAKRAAALEQRLAADLPAPGEVLDEATRSQAGERGTQQSQLRGQGEQLDQSELSDPLPEHGRRALREANEAMQRAARAFEQADGRAAGRAASAAQDALQRAIDSLRQSSPPPPAGGGGDSSTEAERDRSLRDAVVEAMRERQKDAEDDAVSRYYEELLE